MLVKSCQFCHGQANWIIRQAKMAVEVNFWDFPIFLTHPTNFGLLEREKWRGHCLIFDNLTHRKLYVFLLLKITHKIIVKHQVNLIEKKVYIWYNMSFVLKVWPLRVPLCLKSPRFLFTADFFLFQSFLYIESRKKHEKLQCAKLPRRDL